MSTLTVPGPPRVLCLAFEPLIARSPSARRMKAQLVAKPDRRANLDPRRLVCRVLPKHQNQDSLDDPDVTLASAGGPAKQHLRMRVEMAIQGGAEELGRDGKNGREEDGRSFHHVKCVICRQRRLARTHR